MSDRLPGRHRARLSQRVAGADEAIVVTTPEVSAIRDADRVLGMLGRAARQADRQPRAAGDGSTGDMLSVEDVAEILSREVLGVVPDDEEIIDTTNRGEPVIAGSQPKTQRDLHRDRPPTVR